MFPVRINGTGEAAPEVADGKASLLVGDGSVVCCIVKGLRAIAVAIDLPTVVVCFFMDEVKLIVGDD